MTDDFRGEAVAFVIGSSDGCFHAISMPDRSLFGKLTIPIGFRSLPKTQKFAFDKDDEL
jgi:hypothetical protein